MDVKQFHTRARVIICALLAVVMVFGGLLYNLQVVNGAYYLENSSRSIVNTETVQAARGDILDRYGRVLVTNRASYQVTLDSKLMGDIQGRNSTVLKLLEVCRAQGVTWTDTLPVTASAPFVFTTDSPYQTVTTAEDGTTTTSATRLAKLLALLKLKNVAAQPSEEALVTALRTYFEVDEAIGVDEGRQLVGVLYEMALRSKDVVRTSYVFAEDVDINFITAVKEKGLSGVQIDTVTVREYKDTYTAHLLGQVGPIYAEDWDNYKDKGYSQDAIVGKFGVESAFEDVLRGTSGTKDIELSQSGKVVSESWHTNLATGEVETPQPGSNVMLTIDSDLQRVAAESLQARVPGMTDQVQGASVVVTDMTGGVLALVSYPSFDPATYYQDYNELLADPLNPLLNRALQGLYAPGSTFKMAVAVGALEEGDITTTEEILDTGRYKHYDRIEDQPMCWYYRQYGLVHGWENVSEAIRDSCNVFFYETGLRLGISKMDTYAALFGLGKTTGLELYEYAGEVAGPETSKKHDQTWYEGDTMYAAIGQGNTQVTPIQLANYVATLVNGGTNYPTHLLKAVKSSDFSQVEEEYRPEARNTIEIDPKNLEAVKSGMGMAASEGSAAPFFKDLPVTIGAKTGTAQIASKVEANAVFVAFAPYDNPEIAISIVVEKGGSGTAVSAIAADILSYYFSAKDSMEALPSENALVR